MLVNLVDNLSDAYETYSSRISNISKSINKSFGYTLAESTAHDIIPYNSFQQIVRPLFGKTGFNDIEFGDHPDFKHLKNTGLTEYCSITTLFMDIAGSTRLNLFYTPEEVRVIKNTFICVAIDMIKAFDGHVHRIMGDAVMAYFGGKNTSPENAVVDAINCASTMRYLTDTVITPRLDKLYEEPFAIRIGVDYGQKEKVLWGAYGYPGMNEVTATSFYVDVASKLQHSASRNDILIGQNLKEFLDFPDDIIETKTKIVNGVEIKDYYVEPNYSLPNNQKMNYRKYRLDWKEYLKYTEIGVKDKKFFYNSTTALNIDLEIFDENTKLYEGFYKPGSFVLDKNKLIRFKLNMPYVPSYPCKIVFKVENHGNEASKYHEYGNHQTIINIKNETDFKKIIYHNELTRYRGLHYMKAYIKTPYNKTNETCIGVFIK